MSCTEVRFPPKVTILPLKWKEITPPIPYQSCYSGFTSKRKIIVIVSEEFHDNRWWRHVSCSLNNQIPSWKDLREVKDVFIGKDKKAFQIFPPEKEYVNIHPYVLHLWCPLGHDPLPDFRTNGMI
jgi:hypothetical protein